MDAGQTNRREPWRKPPVSENGIVNLELLSAARGILVQLLTQLTVYKVDRVRQRAASCKQAHTLDPKQQREGVKECHPDYAS